MKNGKIYQLYEALSKLKEKELPVSVSFPIARNLSTLQPIVNDIFQQRMVIISKYKEPNDPTQVQLKYIGQCNQELDELADIDVEVSLMKIRLSSFPSDIMIAPELLLNIESILEED